MPVDLVICTLCGNLISVGATSDPDAFESTVGTVCGDCIRAKGAADELLDGDDLLKVRAADARAALDAVRVAFERHVANEETAHAMCSFIEQYMRERGHAVDVRHEWVGDPMVDALHRAFTEAGFACVVGRERGLRFTMTPRDLRQISVRFTVNV